MESVMVCVCDVGQLVAPKDVNFDFEYNKKRYKACLSGVDFQELREDMKRNDFKLLSHQKPDGQHFLSLFLKSNYIPTASGLENRRRVLCKIFANTDDLQLRFVPQHRLASLDSQKYITTELYELLREAHEREPVINCEQDVQHKSMSAVLRGYQTQAVRWLVMRESSSVFIEEEYARLENRQPEFGDFFVNCRNLSITQSVPEKFVVRTGGILGDEMGLGKTVEMLALILVNPRRIVEPDVRLSEIPHKKAKFSDRYLFCLCGRVQQIDLVECSQCPTAQHRKCVQNNDVELDDPYVCPACSDQTDLLQSGGTVIVSPEAIKMQWYSEIKKHTKDALRVLVYPGLGRQWISPRQLASYDVILVDYATIQREFYFSGLNETSVTLRRAPSFMRVYSPLLRVHWWRVCLDEAQMVESSSTLAAKMVKLIPATHRWAVTGTPINKSIDDLIGLFEFLDIYPLCVPSTWNSLISQFVCGETQPLVSILQNFMWRTSKLSLQEDLGIPPQTEEVHYVELSDIEKIFYRSQHSTCASSFLMKVDKLGGSELTEIDPKTLKNILEPLRILRQVCTIPIVCKKSDDHAKQLLQPTELMEHLASQNEQECKMWLRTMASAYNGIAAMHFIKRKYALAINYYESVFRLAKEHTGSICVDSLLQIHALANIIKAIRASKSQSDVSTYEDNLNKLEWKYLDPYASVLRKSELSLEEVSSKASISRKFNTAWVAVVSYFDTIAENQMLLRINELKDTVFKPKKSNNRVANKFQSLSAEIPLTFQTLDSFIFSVNLWYTKMFDARKSILKQFEKLKPFSDNVKPRVELTAEIETDMQAFINKIFVCHLYKLQTADKGGNKSKNEREDEEKNKTPCILCVIREKLDVYECLIFNKTRNEGTKVVDGSWNPSFEETCLQMLYQAAKNRRFDEEVVEDCETTLELINSLKEEFKALTKVWIEIEYTVKAYDEINMCKMRIIAVDPDKVTDMEDFGVFKYVDRAVVSIYELDFRLEEYNFELQKSQMELTRKLARLRYLRHLQGAKNPGVCPICQHEPESKYCVLDCGHHMCMVCWQRLLSHSDARKILCAVCREEHLRKTVHFVRIKPLQTEYPILGDNSAKIEKIILTVLKLKKAEENVKILIFSQWDSILEAISKTLGANGITNRFKGTSASINDFKNNDLGVTCLLLLLRQGAKGLNLTEATHVFIVEPILNPGEEQQAIGRVHRLGQTRPTTVHRFIVKCTVEDNIFETVSRNKSGNWKYDELTVEKIKEFFMMPTDIAEGANVSSNLDMSQIDNSMHDN